jgi:hypothetical protein
MFQDEALFETKDKKERTASGIEYNCSICKQTFYLSSIEILKHKKSHTN